MVCEDINTVCSESTDPGAPLASRVYVEEEPGTFLDPFDVFETDIVISVDGQDGAIVTDLDVSLDISHTWVGDLSVSVISPSGTFVRLFIGSGCGNDDLLVIMDDEASNTNNDFLNACNPVPPAISGSFRPLDLLSAFDGEALNGDWTIKVSDLFFFDGGIVNAITLSFGQSGGTVSLPIPDGATYYPTGNNNEFEVIGFDACGPVTLTYFDNVQLNDNKNMVCYRCKRECFRALYSDNICPQE